MLKNKIALGLGAAALVATPVVAQASDLSLARDVSPVSDASEIGAERGDLVRGLIIAAIAGIGIGILLLTDDDDDDDDIPVSV